MSDILISEEEINIDVWRDDGWHFVIMWGAHWETVKCQPWWISGPRPTLPTHRLHHNSEARGTWRLTPVWCGAVAGLIWFFLDDWFSFSPIVGIKWHWREWCRTLYGCNVSLNVLIPRGDTDTLCTYYLYCPFLLLTNFTVTACILFTQNVRATLLLYLQFTISFSLCHRRGGQRDVNTTGNSVNWFGLLS